MQALEDNLYEGGTTIMRAAFEHSYFVEPALVRAKTPYYPDRARLSREHYPKKQRGDTATWEGREVKLGDNGRAQLAWNGYTGKLLRGSGYSVRHIWGHPWNPDAFTAGWNLCYMPFWAGPLTEDQHPHQGVLQAVRQASWELFFREQPVCNPPDFVKDPGIDLDNVLDGQPLLLLLREARPVRPEAPRSTSPARDPWDLVTAIRSQRNQSWVNICKAIRMLQGRHHQPFNTTNVKNTAKSDVGRIKRETRLSLAQLEKLLKEHGKWS